MNGSNPEGLAPGSIFANDFQVVRRLSAGGMGSVYVALQISTGKERALKLMLPQLVADPALRRRFEQEARIGSLIQSDHVVEVVGAGVDGASGTPWLVMELLRGEDLSSFAERGAASLTVVVAILRQLCHAVGAAHAAGVVHRDLKPENIFLAESKRADETHVVKVLDFGIARMTFDAATKQTGAVGSPIWMAPEQTERGVVTAAADVWALGLIAFRLLTGRCFWISAESGDASIHQIMREVLFDPIPTAASRAAYFGVAESLPPWFDSWFAGCVARDPSARFPDASGAFAAFTESCGALVTPSTPPMNLPSRIPGSSIKPPPSGSMSRARTEVAGAMTGTSPVAFPTLVGGEPGPPKRRGLLVGLLGLIVIASGVGGAALWKARAHPPATRASAPPTQASDSSAASDLPTPETKIDPATPLPPARSSAIAAHKPRPPVHAAPSSELSAELARAAVPEPVRADGAFDRPAAIMAFSMVDIQPCAQLDGPRGFGRVHVTFNNDGLVMRISFEDEAKRFAGTPVGQCLTQKFRSMRVSPFAGNPAHLIRPFNVN